MGPNDFLTVMAEAGQLNRQVLAFQPNASPKIR